MYYFAHEGHDHDEVAAYTARHTSSNYTLPIIFGVFSAITVVVIVYLLIKKKRETKAPSKPDAVK